MDVTDGQIRTNANPYLRSPQRPAKRTLFTSLGALKQGVGLGVRLTLSNIRDGSKRGAGGD